MPEATVTDALKKQRESLTRVQSVGGKNYIGYFDQNQDFFYGVKTNHIEEYISLRLRDKEVKMQLPAQQTTVTYFDDEDLIKFDECVARLDRAVKIQANYALADVFDNQCSNRDMNTD
jgi:hypothetical protein